MLKDVNVISTINATSAGTSDVNGSTIDMQGYDGVLFVVALGTLTSTQVTKLKAQQGQDSGLSDAADLAGSATGAAADGDGNKLLVLDLYKPLERYVRCVVDRGTANAVIDKGIAIQYKNRVGPITQGSTVSQVNTVVSPAEGTA